LTLRVNFFYNFECKPAIATRSDNTIFPVPWMSNIGLGIRAFEEKSRNCVDNVLLIFNERYATTHETCLKET